MTGLLDRQGVVVTGAGRGLGRAFAMSAARGGAGVVVNDVDADEANTVVAAITREGGRAIAVAASIAEPDAAAEIVDRCVREFGSVDGLINNAVRYGFGHPWDEDPAELRRQLEVNLLGALYCGAQAMRHMKERRRGSIVNLTSNVMMGSVGMSTYGMTKGALACLTFGWALEMMPYGVRVNALAPGAITRGSDLAGPFARPNKAQDTPEMIAPAAMFLLSELSAEITGQIVFLMGKRLGLMTRPQLIEPVLERDDWTAETIAEAYDGVFRPLLQPVGRAGSSYEWAREDAAPAQ